MEDSYVLQLLKPKFKDFHLCFCGFCRMQASLHGSGPAARPNYILHYVMKGKGIYLGRRNEVSAERRAGLLNKPGKPYLLSGR